MSVPPLATNQLRAACALAIVSCVVKVFDAMMNSVCSGFTRRSTGSMSCPSTFDTKWKRDARVHERFRARGTTICGPEIRAADADVDDMADAAVGGVAHLLGERKHAFEHVVHLALCGP